jgi:VWFA-related protein
MTQLQIALAVAALSMSPITQAGDRPAAPTLRIDVVAIDERGATVTDLRPAELEVWISGYRAPIAEVSAVTPVSHPPTIVLLLDNMAIGPTIVPHLKQVARHFVNRMAPGEQLAILPLHGGALGFTGDREQLLNQIEAFYPRGFPFRPEDAGEDVLGTMETLARGLEERSAGRRIIVGIGAGWLFDRPLPPPGIRDLNAQWISAMRAMAAANASLYVIDPVGLRPALGAGAYGGESGLARQTGGYAFLTTNDLESAADRIRAEASFYYILRTANPPVQRGADLRDLEVKVRRKGVTVRARRAITGRP